MDLFAGLPDRRFSAIAELAVEIVKQRPQPTRSRPLGRARSDRTAANPGNARKEHDRTMGRRPNVPLIQSDSAFHGTTGRFWIELAIDLPIV
jgi:hypothetical protein